MAPEIQRLSDAIRDAAAAGRALRIVGGGTKDFYGGAPRGEPLDATGCRGIVEYEPTELVVTVRGGTPLAEVEAALAERGQMLAFEPPHFGELAADDASAAPPERRGRRATVGGCVAAGLSGPRRPYAGALRDFVLGVRIVDGHGQALAFGGRVMKNVAGFDVSRLMAGALGTLGVLTEVSLKVLPVPPAETTVELACDEAEAIARMTEWAGKPWPVTATAWRGGELRVRLSGAEPAVAAAAARLGGSAMDRERARRYWRGVREHADSFFAGPLPLWRLSLRPGAPAFALPGEVLVEWSGALRWLRTEAAPAEVRAAAEAAGGHATLFHGGDRALAFHPLPAGLLALHRRLKQAFDPAGILNPGRLHQDI